MDIFHVLFYVPLFNLLMFLAQNVGSIGWAIIIVAAVSKLVTYPLTKGQIEQASKSKDLQAQVKSIQKQYKYNKEKLAQELAKVQAKALPGQLKGCVSLIIFIVFFFQIRGTIVDLVNRGYHAFNTVAYSESLKRKEDSIKFDMGDQLAQGKHNITIELEASNGSKMHKVIDFEVVSDVNKRMDEIKNQELDKSENQRKSEADAWSLQLQNERASDISVYNTKFESGLKSIAVKSFLIFPTESVQRYLLTDNADSFEFYLRPPSGATILAEKTKVSLDSQDITAKSQISQGEAFNLNFAGMNLSRVAADFNIWDLSITAPYIVVALISAVTQYGVTQMYSATNITTTSTDNKVDDKKPKAKKKKDEKKDEPDMAEAMAESMQMTNKLLPAFTFALSLGYLGGASFLPTGVTLFWTAQNTFVIIQQLVMNRKEVYVKLQKRFDAIRTKLSKVKNTENGTK
jgi:membrane protein insertase Oxa1/YidC/SpoIIIJ